MKSTRKFINIGEDGCNSFIYWHNSNTLIVTTEDGGFPVSVTADSGCNKISFADRSGGEKSFTFDAYELSTLMLITHMMMKYGDLCSQLNIYELINEKDNT